LKRREELTVPNSVPCPVDRFGFQNRTSDLLALLKRCGVFRILAEPSVVGGAADIGCFRGAIQDERIGIRRQEVPLPFMDGTGIVFFFPPRHSKLHCLPQTRTLFQKRPEQS
jgi:hypothetical protein